MLRSIVKQSGESMVNSNRITLDRSPDQGTDAAGGRGEMSGCVSPVGYWCVHRWLTYTCCCCCCCCSRCQISRLKGLALSELPCDDCMPRRRLYTVGRRKNTGIVGWTSTKAGVHISTEQNRLSTWSTVQLRTAKYTSVKWRQGVYGHDTIAILWV